MRRVEPSDLHGGPSVSEAQLRARVVTLAHAAGWKVFSLPVSRTLHSVKGGGKPPKGSKGYLDLTLARHGVARWMELKAEYGVLSKEQREWLDALPHGHAFVITPDDLLNGRLVRLLA